MALFPSRPRIELYVQEAVFSGRPARLEVEVIAEDDTKVEYIDVVLVGHQGWQIGSGKSQISNAVAHPKLSRRVYNGGTLAAGQSRKYAVRFGLPHDVPPSHELLPARASLEVTVEVGIPWWPDAKRQYLVPVRLPVSREVARTPSIGRSRTTSVDAARLEVSVASTTVIAGEVLTGACAAFHMSDSRPREVDIELVPSLLLRRGRRTWERRADGYGVTVTLPPGSAGNAVPFQIALPKVMTPSFEADTHDLRWFLIASTGSIFTGRTEVVLPLTVFDQTAAAHTPRLAEAPKLGDEKMEALFARFALRHGWRRLPTPAGVDEVAITGAHGKSTLELAYAYRGKGGAFLVARLHTPSLGLGLSVVPSGLMRHLLFADLEVGIAEWDRAHRAAARTTSQAAPFVKAVVPALRDASSLGRLVRWDDDTLVFEREVVDLDDTALADAKLLMQAVAGTIERERESIVPPPGLDVDVAAWRALADKLDGELAVGDLAIRGGRVGHTPVELGLTFDDRGEPRDLRIVVGSADTASGALRELAWTLPRPPSDVLGANVPASIVDRITRWPSNVSDLAMRDGLLGATMQLGGSWHPDEVGAIVHDLVAVRSELEPAAGPYR